VLLPLGLVHEVPLRTQHIPKHRRKKPGLKDVFASTRSGTAMLPLFTPQHVNSAAEALCCALSCIAEDPFVGIFHAQQRRAIFGSHATDGNRGTFLVQDSFRPPRHLQHLFRALRHCCSEYASSFLHRSDESQPRAPFNYSLHKLFCCRTPFRFLLLFVPRFPSLHHDVF
jgi:hypothetical protein